mmetsp:Transcript_1286/g.2819  ORF Transcript_1286/g.2819 Transcript_1286/m.2819 type:complete len:313 (-) Transcript_1286:117-1055(-)
MQVNALFKKAAPAPAKTAAPAKKSPFGGFGAKKAAAAPAPAKTVKKTAAKPVVTKKATPVKKATAPVKKATTVRKAAPSKVAAKGDSKWYGPNRKLYLPSGLLSTADIPSYLDGTLAGDYGFDPLGLGADGKINQYRVAEVIHARWAMLAIPGFVIPEALGLPGGVWTETGKVFLDGETGRPEFLEFVPLFAAIQIALMAGVEKFRSEGAGPAGFVPFKGKFDESAFNGLDPINPGGPLDFFNVAATPQDLAELKVKEIKNGRLAMIAALGCFLQAPVTHEGPAANWGKHVANPFVYNFVTIASGADRTPVL